MNTASQSTPRNSTDSPLRARWELNDLASRDGHRILAVFSATLRPLPEPAERKFFEETFLTANSAVSIDQILAHFRPRLHSSASALVAAESAELMLAETSTQRWIDALRTAADAVAFSCGIAVLPPFSVELSSPTLQHERLDQMQRAVAKRTTTQRLEHFQQAASLLQQWESIKAATPSISPGLLLKQMNPTDQGAMLETLLMASAEQAAHTDLWAVAGTQLVRIVFKTDSAGPQFLPLPTNAGPLRSVQRSDGRVLVGGQKGVIVLNINAPAEAQTYLDPDLVSEHGFTRVLMDDRGIFACHRDGGIVHWEIGQTDRPAQVIRSSQLGAGAKHLISISNGSPQYLFAAGERLLKLGGNSEVIPLAALSAPIAAILNLPDRIVVASEDGTIAAFDTQSLQEISRSRPVGRLTGAALMPWLSTSRILLTTPDGPIYCIGLDDPLVTQYSSAHLAVRAAAGSNKKVAALSADRQRVILWNPWDGRKPETEIHLTSTTRHRVADIAFG